MNTFRTFDEIWTVSQHIPQEGAYSEAEGRVLFETAMALPQCSTIMEIGCEHGRSTSLLAAATREKHHQLILVDPFVDFQADALDSCIGVLVKADIPFTLHLMKTADIPEWGIPALDMLHIDGDHSVEGLKLD